MATVEFYQEDSEKKDWRWRVKANNGVIIGSSSEGFKHRTYAENNLRSLPYFCHAMDIKFASEAPETANRPLSFYRDEANEWRWRITANNGRITHASSEGFSSKQAAVDNLTGLTGAVEKWNEAG